LKAAASAAFLFVTNSRDIAMKQNWVDLIARDGATFRMYVAEPAGTPKGAIVVLQEIFGVNAHIRSICDRLAGLGYVAGAPALFDRLEPGYETGYGPEDVAAGRAILSRFDFTAALGDIAVAIDALKPYGKVGVLGFCLGGSLAYVMATTDPSIAAAVAYYGSRVADLADKAPLCPTIAHFGETDHSIPMEAVETVRQKQPGMPVYTYPAGHGFNCDARSAYEPESAKLAWERTMAFFESVMG
jgi:carboxymethylenebutenolidase